MMRETSRCLLCLVSVFVVLSMYVYADDFYLKDGETVVFFGDSITQAGIYVQYVDTFLSTRFPEKSFIVINRGKSSETVAGTSEKDHDPPRPNAHDRFTRDIPPLEPDVVVSCFGMNDGNYHPFDPALFAKYRSGIHKLIHRVRHEAKARPVILTPAPYDAYSRRASDPDAVEYGYKFPAVGYDNVMGRYSGWLCSLRSPELPVVDIHSKLNQYLNERRKQEVSYSFSPDGVHPNATGHWLMAQTLLEAWNAPAECAELVLNLETMRVEKGETGTVIRKSGEGISFDWITPLPMPIDPAWDQDMLEIARTRQILNRYRMRITGLTAEKYMLMADKKKIATVTKEQLENGIDLLDYPEFPTVSEATKVLDLVKERHNILYRAWRATINDDGRPDPEAKKKADRLKEEIREHCKPRAVTIKILWL